MANIDSTLTSTEESRAGAMACLKALRAIENINGNFHTDNSMEAWWRDEDNAVAVMLQAAGKPDGFTAGFVATFAEYFKVNNPRLKARASYYGSSRFCRHKAT